MGKGSLESQEYLKGSLHGFQGYEYIKFCFCVEAFFVVSVELVKTMKITLRNIKVIKVSYLRQLCHIHLYYSEANHILIDAL